MATPEAREFAALLKELKDRSGRSYGVLAGRLHVSTSTLHRYCNGDAVPNEYAPVERLARLCGAGPDELVELHRRWILADAARRRPAVSPEAVPPPAAVSVPEPVPVVPVAESAAAPAPAPAPAPEPGPETEPVTTPAPESGSESNADASSGSDAVTGGAGRPRPRRFWSSPRTRVLLATAAVVALTVPTTVLVNKFSGSDPGDKGAGVETTDVYEGASALSDEKPGASRTPGATKSSGSPSASGSPTASASSGKGRAESAEAGGAGMGGGGGGKADGGVPLTATISSYNWDDPCDQFYVLDQEPDDVPPPPPSQERRSWARALGGVDGGRMKLEITVQGKSGQAVVLNGMHVRTLSRKAPLPWSAYSMGEGCGSGVTPQTFDIDLDDNRPTLTPVAGHRGDEQVPPKDFPFRVSSSDVEVFDLDAHVEGHDVSWYLELEWSSGGRQGTLRIDDHGKPFRTSSIKTRPMYIYWHDTAQWKPPEIPIE
ncbi:helix-turn-helix transcriptional regulator [Streptomyces sp. ML-6]|uniref:helix-turn-helix domain-containing protein n=1 Tax=Streptomyces sp. ML-6 TaxID=2982693 RepID=UPI0024C0CBF2|nr:helix-turn-helix transcriptional regulator [Streptomyces sp. ML-6]MDK0520197.1 helix-turn-helix domain-containing protein [Streptomyces sp. ML-6]